MRAEMLEDVQSRVQGMRLVEVELIEPGPAEGLSLHALHARQVNTSRCEKPHVFFRKVAPYDSDEPNRHEIARSDR